MVSPRLRTEFSSSRMCHAGVTHAVSALVSVDFVARAIASS
jgi:hypothetical protein